MSSRSEMHTCSDYVTSSTCGPVVSLGPSNTHDKNECAFEVPLGASQCRPVNIYCLKIPKTVMHCVILKNATQGRLGG